jgi:ATP-dependent Clp protease ATP-binding subunit ClpA
MCIEIKHKKDRHDINTNHYPNKHKSSMWSQPDKLFLNLLASHGISVDVIDNYSSRFNAIPVGPQFNKAKSNILLSKTSSSKAVGCQVFVDDDLKYLGRNTVQIKAFTGCCNKNWRRLLVEPVLGNISESLCRILEILESPIAHEARLTVNLVEEERQELAEDLSENILVGFGKIISPEMSAQAYQKVIYKELATEIAVVISRTEIPSSVILWGQSGVGKDLVMLAAVHPLFQKNQTNQVIQISGWEIGIGSIFPAEIDNSLRLILTEAQKQDCLLLVQDIDVCLSGTEVSRSLLCNAIDNGLHLIASVRTPTAASRLAQDMSIFRRLLAVKVEEPSPEEMLEVLQQISKRSPVKVQPSAIQAILSLSQRGLVSGSEPALSIGILSGAIHQAEWKKTQVDPDLVYSILKGQWPDI